MMQPKAKFRAPHLACHPLSCSGFTLMELLVALAIFSLLAAMAYGGLRMVLDSRDQVDHMARRLGELQMAFTVLERDVEQALPRPIRDEYGDRQPPMRGGSSDEGLLEFTHAGWRNPADQARSHLQRVAYRIEDTQLLRDAWPVLDRAQDSAPQRFSLIKNVETVSLRFLDDKLQWHQDWPVQAVPADAAELPRAIEISIELTDWGTVTRLFRVPGALKVAS